MRRLRCVVVALALSLSSSVFAQSNSASASAPQKSAFEQMRDLTQLDRKDAKPFHLKMDVQLYDMSGKPAHTGTIEEWWAAPDEYRIETTSGSLHEITATGGQPNTPTIPNRESYLLEQLWQQTVSPLSGFYSSATATAKINFGSTQLDCFVGKTPFVQDADPFTPPMYCTDPGKQNVRVVRNGFEFLLRNSLGTFQGTTVALSSTITYLGRTAISGKISTLESFTPGSPGTPPLQPDPPVKEEVSATTRLAGASGVRGGRLLKHSPPIYPDIARLQHLSGIVLLHAIIMKDGKTGSIFAIASPNESLTLAAIDAVRGWEYEPYLLNGAPTEVDTIVRVGFNFN
ncbi:MAG TPA: energy transducer TonB [Acidobacteriaceae bacterium]